MQFGGTIYKHFPAQWRTEKGVNYYPVPLSSFQLDM